MIAYPFFISIGFGGGVMYTLKIILSYFISLVRSRMYCEIRIESEDQSYKWVNKYMQDKGFLEADTNL